VIADGNANVLTEDPEHEECREGLPGEEEEGSKSEDMEQPEDNSENPFERPAVLLRHLTEACRQAARKNRRGRNLVF
jgi:hypothetical protein